MCQLFAISSTCPQEINPLLQEFFTHAIDNPHGWGYAGFSDTLPLVVRSPEPADTCGMAADFLARRHLANEAMAHIRYATIGQIELANCHPFVASDVCGRHWTLAHKGTIFDFAPLNPYFKLQTGSTDSERILLYLLSQINAANQAKGAPLDANERFEIFTQLAADISLGNCLNLLVYDSDCLYVYSNYQGGLAINRSKDTAVFCTSELQAVCADTPWQPLTLCQAQSYKCGKLVRQANNIGQQYQDKDEDLRYLYQDFAAL
jgi:glutamine amidotransferase